MASQTQFLFQVKSGTSVSSVHIGKGKNVHIVLHIST
jgi:hypothetical protein